MAQQVKAEVRMQIRVKKGPGRFDLMLGLFEGKVLTFTLGDGRKMQFCVTGLQLESGSRQDWIVSGYNPVIRSVQLPLEFYYCSDPNHDERSRRS